VTAGRPLSLRAAGVRVVLLDIEGTTTPIAFVHEVLFPYARAAVRAYLADASPNDPDIRRILNGLRDEHARDTAQGHAPPAWPEDAGAPQRAAALQAVDYLHWLMDRDRKSGPLKTLQGMIWERGYAAGDLHGEVYPDVRPALERWKSAGIGIGIFSSGSVLAQKLLFSSTSDGDLTAFFTWHFDTAVGAKQHESSYVAIARTIGVPPHAILFISDVEQEVHSARAAGLHTLLCVRGPMEVAVSHAVVGDFDGIEP
jgi:enolase-phosphatase E1